MTENNVPRMRPIRTVAKETGVSYDHIRKLCNKNAIAHIRCGKKILVNYDAFIDYLNNSGRV